MTVWSALLCYAAVQALCLFSLLTNIKKGTTVLSSDGIHSVLAYATSIILLGGFLSIRRRAEVNDFLRRLDQYTNATRDPQVPYKSSSVSFLYAILAILVVHSACLSYTTSVLNYKIIPKASTVIPLPSDNATAAKGATGPQSGLKAGQGAGGFGGGLDDLSMGGVFDAGQGAEGDEHLAGGSGTHMDRPGHGDEGGEPADDGELDDETHEGRRRRRSAHRNGHRAPPVREIVVVASHVVEDDVNDLIDSDNETADVLPDPGSEEKILFRSRRGLIDSAIDEDIDGDGVNFIEFFKPFSLAITTTRYFIIKNIIYLSVTLLSCFCKIIRHRLLEVNTRLAGKQTPELTVDMLADMRQKHSQCLSLLREIEQNFSFFCLLWNMLTFLEIVYIGRMIYEINATTLYELPEDPFWTLGYSVVLCVDIVLVAVFHLNFVHSAANARLEALKTVDLVTIGTASIPPNRIEAHQQAELLVSVATIRDPGLSVWDIIPQTQVFGYFVLLLAYIVVFAHIQFLRDGQWMNVFGHVLQKEPEKVQPPVSDEENLLGSDIGAAFEEQVF